MSNPGSFSVSFDLPVVIALVIAVFTIGAAIVRNAIAIAAASSRSIDNKVDLVKLHDDLNDYKLACAVTFVTNANLKIVEERLITAVNSFGAQLDRHTDRLDRLFTPVDPNKK